MALSPIAIRMHDLHGRIWRHLLQRRARSVRGPIVDHDDLARHRKLDPQQPFDHGSNGGRLVEDRDNDRDEVLGDAWFFPSVFFRVFPWLVFFRGPDQRRSSGSVSAERSIVNAV